ncbi:MAG: SusC/RagA family TonB-linked outer membrane protein [Chitinophagaceae bacterium]|jgi:TonB-linked SusC/RagA family outer membrane protein|nr:SusC/RagA family TonB-linked outer membrane protein [Chitinophagaceae bacterium]MBK7680655.1 SusC/RagA family TonB-linked outer membrane protein [Chitinophagaceae bacterium]MBK8300541.1 SusC/RagA family TonB-linked outer membrane protein [Chitinophagaceae bacterium]MBK9465050.1 SusC/RagA family TonB-linked outer membrane protein [Chitinophagaceae bacterium]MBK9660218.1 SusC/RagA family TonB-linked outer membrane protein [Chitinophagaceae bacterium]
MRKIASLFTMLMLFAALAFGQNRTITGTVTNEKGEPVPNASVTIKGSRTGVSADNNGQFRILAKTGDILVASSSGMESSEATVGAGSTINFSVKTIIIAGTEVVVTALGQSRQPKELGYSVSKVKAAELTQAKSVNLQNGLTGKVSGLNVQTVNNGVFADTRITLRGIRSLTGNNQPMLILDGVPIALSYLSSINPNDITDVTILKSASATAIYGPDGANGALVITTKRGSRTRPQVSVSHTVQVEKVSYMPEFQTQFGSGSSVDAFGYGVYDPIENQCYGDEFDGSLRQIGRDGPGGEQYLTEYIARPKEKLKFWNTGITNQTDVSFSTGDFYLSAQNVLIQGIMPKDVNRRVSVRMAANKEYGTKFKASYSVNYTKGNYDVTAGSSFGNGRDYTVYWNLINTPMQIPLTRFKDWRGETGSDGNINWANPNYFFNDYYSNPYFMIDNFRAKGRTEDVFGNVELNFKANSWLSFTYRLGATISSTNQKATAGAYTYNAFSKANKAIASSGDIVAQVQDLGFNSSRINSEFFATTRNTFGKFKVESLLGQSFREDNSRQINVGSNNLAFPELFNIIGRKGDLTSNLTGENTTKSRLGRFFGKVSVGFNNWAFLEVTGSYDINSRLFSPYDPNGFKNAKFFYPGTSLSLLLSEAIPAIKNSKVVSYLKLRGAISKTGNVNLGAQSLENTYGLGGGFPYGTLVGYTSGNTLRLPSYTPEFVKNKEVGFELGLLKNRINIEATAYTQDNTDQIVQVQYSGATGFTSALLNAASFTNKGLEFDLRLTPLVKIRNVSIDFKANYTYQTNEVTKIIEGVDQLGIGNGNYVIVGKPAYTFQLTDYVRDDQGRVVVSQTSGLPTVDPTIKPFGHTQPNHLLGLNLSVTWKDLTFSAVADYRGGAQIYTGNLGNGMDFSGVSKRSAQNSRQPFIFPNSSYFDGTKYVENTDIYTISGGYNFWSQAVNTAANSNYIVSADFWKIREVSLSYNIPAKVFGFTKNAIKGATFTVSGRNLFMFLPKTNEWTDPEFSNTTGNAQGVSGLDNTPPTRIFGASLNIQL